MSTAQQGEAGNSEQYKLLLELWRRERALSRHEFLGFIIATTILILVSLSGSWWPPLLGIIISKVWLILSARSAAQQGRLYAEMEAFGTSKSDNRLFKVHSFEQEEVKIPLLGPFTRLVQPISRNVFIGTPILFVVIWLLGFIIAVFT